MAKHKFTRAERIAGLRKLAKSRKTPTGFKNWAKKQLRKLGAR